MLKAVICDDEKATKNIISYFLASEEIPIKIIGTAANGRESVDLINRKNPDLAFLDINMPNLNGFEVIEHLNNNDTKIIIVTVYDTFAYAQRALRLGARDIISKPIDIEQLKQAIARAIGWNFTNNNSLNRAFVYIHKHYSEKIEMGMLAGEACCTRTHLAHLIKEETGMTATQYINRIRINQAVTLLKNGKSVQETACGVGYESLNNFYKYFKEFTGKTPANFTSADFRQI